MNILSLPLLVIAGALGVIGAAGVVCAVDDADVSSGSEDPPHAAMVAVITRALNKFKARRLLGNSLLVNSLITRIANPML